MAARIDHLVTSGTFALDGGEWDVDNNVWIVGDDHEAIVIDAAHDAAAIEAALGGRTLRAIVCTHAHNDHIDAAPDLARATGAPILLHPDDLPLWLRTHPEHTPDGTLTDGQELTVAGIVLTVLHTPGHAPAPSACTPPNWAPSSPATPSSRAAPAPPAGRSRPSRRSSTRSGTGCSRSRATPRSAPATATPPPSARRPRTSTSGSSAATERRPPHPSGQAESRSPLTKRRGSPPTGSVNSSTRASNCNGREKSSAADSASTTGYSGSWTIGSPRAFMWTRS